MCMRISNEIIIHVRYNNYYHYFYLLIIANTVIILILMHLFSLYQYKLQLKYKLQLNCMHYKKQLSL